MESKANQRTILSNKQFDVTVTRLALELIESYKDFENSVLIGLQPRGIYLAKLIHKNLLKFNPNSFVKIGALDATFYRDDYRRNDSPLLPNQTNINFEIENKKVILIDDVLFTGRTIRSGLDAMLAHGRPEQVELLVLINRRYLRELPIQANYTGKNVHTFIDENIKLNWNDSFDSASIILQKPENSSTK